MPSCTWRSCRVRPDDLASVARERGAGQDQARPRPARGDATWSSRSMPEHAPRAGSRPSRRRPSKEVIRTLERRVNQLGVAEAVDHRIRQYGRPGPRAAPGREGRRPGEAAAHRRGPALAAHRGGVGADARGAPPELQGARAARLSRSGGPGHRGGERAFYLVRREAMMTGRDLKTARAGVGEHGEPNVAVHPESAPAAARSSEETGRNIGRRLAIVLDERVTSAPVDRAAGGRGGTDPRAASRPRRRTSWPRSCARARSRAKMRYLQELTVGASLGGDSIRAGTIASAAAMLFITVFMLAYYRLSGLNAVVALAANLIILLGGHGLVPGHPDPARHRRASSSPWAWAWTRTCSCSSASARSCATGRPCAPAVRNGFDRVWITILDTHATALIAAAVPLPVRHGAHQGLRGHAGDGPGRQRLRVLFRQQAPLRVGPGKRRRPRSASESPIPPAAPRWG